jgi:hypothetical protein
MPEATNVPPNTASLMIAGKIPMLQVPLPVRRVPLPELQVPLPASQAAPLGHLETIEGYLAAYHYAALTNLFCQIYLPSIEKVEDNDVVKAIIDTSYRDFYMLDAWLEALDPKEIQANPRSHLYQETRDVWRDWIKDWTTISKANQQTG